MSPATATEAAPMPSHQPQPLKPLQARFAGSDFGPSAACALPGCDQSFQPRGPGQRFCSPAHKAEYTRIAFQLGDQILRRASKGAAIKAVQSILEKNAGNWTDRPRAPVWRDAIAKLRQRGEHIECRRTFDPTTQAAKYQYRLTPRQEHGR